MAKRRSKEKLKADRIIKAQLLELGEVINVQARETSRRDTGRLQDEQNYRVVKDTTLVLGQLYYGRFNYPLGVTSGEKNALLIAVKEHAPKATNIIVKDITDAILAPFKKKRK